MWEWVMRKTQSVGERGFVRGVDSGVGLRRFRHMIKVLNSSKAFAKGLRRRPDDQLGVGEGTRAEFIRGEGGLNPLN